MSGCTPVIAPDRTAPVVTALPFKQLPTGRTFTVDEVRQIPEAYIAMEVLVGAHGFPATAKYTFDTSSMLADDGAAVLRPMWRTADEPGRWLREVLVSGSFEPLGAVATHEAAPNPHPQYTTDAEAAAIALAAVAVHEAAPDPHPQYTTTTEATAIADASVATHEGLADPHSQYQKESERNAVSGYAGLNPSARVDLIRGGTNADLSGTGGASKVLMQTSPGAAISVAQLAASDLSNGVTGSGAVALATSPTISTPNIDDYLVLDDQGSDPSSPAAGFKRVYAKATGIFVKDSAGVVTGPFGAGMPSGSLGDALFHDGSNWVAVNVTANRYVFVGDDTQATNVIARKLRQADMSYSGNTGHSFVEHWLAGTFAGETGWTSDNSGTGAVVTANTLAIADGNHPGIAEFDTGTSSTGQASLHKGTRTIRLGGGPKVIEFKFRLEDLSTLAIEYDVYIGLSNRKDTSSHFVGVVYDRNTSTNLICRTVDNGVPTDTVSTFVVVADTWITVRIEINDNASSIEFFVQGASEATHTTNIPTAAGREVGPRATILKSASTNNRFMYVDFYGYEDEFTTDS